MLAALCTASRIRNYCWNPSLCRQMEKENEIHTYQSNWRILIISPLLRHHQISSIQITTATNSSGSLITAITHTRTSRTHRTATSTGASQTRLASRLEVLRDRQLIDIVPVSEC
ncbi:hypothetical protein AKJ16_DCAP18103, partial [Drosera capensis]